MSAKAFSPKEWKAFISSDATNAGSTGIGGTMYQLQLPLFHKNMELL